MSKLLPIMLVLLASLHLCRADEAYAPWPLPYEVTIFPAGKLVGDPVQALTASAKEWTTRISGAKIEKSIAVKVEEKGKPVRFEWLVGDLCITQDSATKVIDFAASLGGTPGHPLPPSAPVLTGLNWMATAQPRETRYQGVDCLIYTSDSNFIILDKKSRIPLAVSQSGMCLLYQPLDPPIDFSMPADVKKRLAEAREFFKKRSEYGSMPKLQ